MSGHPISRETFIKGAAVGAAAVSAGFPAFIPSRGEAADVIKIGNTEENTGVYSALARNQTRGMAMVLEKWNKKGGVLGRKVEMVIEDNANDPGVAVQKARKLVNQDKVAALIGTVSSAVALSTSGAANTLNTLFIDTGGHADPITGKNCHWNTFQVCHTTWALSHASGYGIAKKFGKKWYMITPDYAFGHSLAEGYTDVIKHVGGQILENDLAPLGTSDFSPYLTKVLAAKPDVFIVNGLSGDDYVNCMKQASSFGLLKRIPAAGPYAELETVWALPSVARVGYWGTEWYYKGDNVLGSANTEAKAFATEYRKRYNEPPTPRSAFGYVTMDRLLWAISTTKSTDATKLARALEGSEFQSIWGSKAAFRKQDHALIWPMWVGTLRPNGSPSDKYDVFDVEDEEPGDKIFITPEEATKACNLGYP
ncbi:ABC transporter substrate-binding protein [bacterium]|nr:MAG: ABC transporter substrate-binding protein [bacterium]